MSSKARRYKHRPEFQQQIRIFCVPLHFVEKRQYSKFPIVGGSALLWESIEGRFIVTAFHVWSELESRRQNDPANGKVVIYDKTGPIWMNDLKAIDQDEDLDLAVLTSPALAAVSLHGKEFYRTLAWPHAPVSSGEKVAFFGFPGAGRFQSPKKIELKSLYLFQPCVVSQSGREIWMYPEKERGWAYFAPMEKLPKMENLGGISGAPVFADRDNHPEWIGTIRSVSGEDPLRGAIRIIPSTLICANGQLIRS